MQPDTSKPRLPAPWAFVLYLLLAPLAGAWAADLAREQRIAEQISDAIFDGEPLQLEAAGAAFLAIHMRTEERPARGAVLLLHGRGANPDWQDVIHPLRVQLPEYGWDTLSIQLPLASEGAGDAAWHATIEESLPRLQAAIAFLQQQGFSNIVLIAHSFGNHAVARYLADSVPAGIRAWIAIGMSTGEAERGRNSLATLRKLRLPVLDLYGENDLGGVIRSAPERRLAAADAGNPGYEQREVAGADHFFAGQDELLVGTVKSWLAKIAKGFAAGD